ncbi:hypothetical protein [Streptomyces sp. NPDC015131]|uniref:hypothetical protein n=1 Tax=Streptomyces sp. NPDC015131 TaxID=3364941 RepID=UPI003701D6F2
MPFEDEVSEAMHRTGEPFTTDHRALLAGGLRRGRARVLRRRAGTAALAVLALTGSALLGAEYLGPRSAQEVADDSGRPSPGVTRSGEGDPRRVDPDRNMDVSADQMVRILEGALPKGRMTGQRGTSNPGDPDGVADASLVYDDGFGEALVRVSYRRVDPDDPAARKQVVCPAKPAPPVTSCDDAPFPFGVATFRSTEGRGLTQSRTVGLTPEGYLVELVTYNGLPEKGRVTRARPPFTEGQTSNLMIVLGMSMTKYGIANPDAFTRDLHISGSLAVHDRIRRLAPKGLSPRGGGGEGATGYMTAYDVKNKTMSFMRATLTPKGATGDGEPRWTETLPDGTRIATSERPAQGKGVTEWRVDALRPNGLRVTITSYNAEYPHKDANRTTPPATLEQLKTVALDPSWPSLM